MNIPYSRKFELLQELTHCLVSNIIYGFSGGHSSDSVKIT